MSTIQVHDLQFKPFITKEKIQERVAELGAALTEEYKDKNPIFLAILNGSFIFAADLIRACDMNVEMSFIRLSSYEGTATTGRIVTHLGLKENLEGKDVILVEDIIDTGATLHHFIPTLLESNPNSISVVSLLIKPSALKYALQIDHVGFKIPNKFVVGYGLDYNSLGRNLPDIYQLA